MTSRGMCGSTVIIMFEALLVFWSGVSLFLSRLSDRDEFELDLVGLEGGLMLTHCLDVATDDTASTEGELACAKKLRVDLVKSTSSSEARSCGDICIRTVFVVIFASTSLELAQPITQLTNKRINDNM